MPPEADVSPHRHFPVQEKRPMLRLIYLCVMGFAVGAVFGAACGHLMLWSAMGIVLGVVWRRVTRDETQGAANARSASMFRTGTTPLPA
jgi:hypothetical protein